MSGFDRQLPGRKVLNEVISDGVPQKTGVTGWTGQFAVPRYNSWATPLPPSSSARIISTQLASSSVATVITTFSSSVGAAALGQPDYPRAVRVIPSTSAFNAAASSSSFVLVTGTNQFGAVVTDSISMGNGVGPCDGVIAFKTITSVTLPACSSAGTPFTIGLSNIFGLDRTPLSIGSVITGVANGTAETTRGIVCPAASSGNSFPSAATGTVTNATFKFNTAATSSAGALMEVYFLPQDTSHA